MPSREVPVRDSITQLEQRFEQFRTTRRRADEAAGGVVAGGGGAGATAWSKRSCTCAAAGLERAKEAAERNAGAARTGNAGSLRGASRRKRCTG
jgi:hypothetical protein